MKSGITITRLFCKCTDLFIKLINLGVMFFFHLTYFSQSKSWQSCLHCYYHFSSFSPERGVNSSFLSPNTIQSALTTPSPSDFSDLVFAVPRNCAQQWLRNCSNFSFRTTVFSISDDSYCNGLGNFGPSRAGGFALFSVLERKSHLLRPKTQKQSKQLSQTTIHTTRLISFFSDR